MPSVTWTQLKTDNNPLARWGKKKIYVWASFFHKNTLYIGKLCLVYIVWSLIKSCNLQGLRMAYLLWVTPFTYLVGSIVPETPSGQSWIALTSNRINRNGPKSRSTKHLWRGKKQHFFKHNRDPLPRSIPLTFLVPLFVSETFNRHPFLGVQWPFSRNWKSHGFLKF